MTTKEIAVKLVEYCRKGEYEKAYTELYAPDAKSIEPRATFGPKEIQGMEAFKKKGEMWNSMVEEMHGGSVGDPIVSDAHFAVTMTMDVTFKEGGRVKDTELCVYEVKDGKIISEQFFYPET